MIDFHAHIIPGIDDGAKNVLDSIDMMRMLFSQGINKVVATPHFYPGENPPDVFFKKRDEKLGLLLEETEKLNKEEFPKIAKGAEVFFFPTIYSFKDIENLCIEGTNYLLVEMPFMKWTPLVFDSLHKLITNRGVLPIIAHVNRYLSFGNGLSEIDRLKELGAVIQANAEFFNSFLTRRKALSFVKRSLVDVLGSDCHNMEARRPEIGKALSSIEKHLGKEQLMQIEDVSEKILSDAVFR